jgi:hypothetical protein
VAIGVLVVSPGQQISQLIYTNCRAVPDLFVDFTSFLRILTEHLFGLMNCPRKAKILLKVDWRCINPQILQRLKEAFPKILEVRVSFVYLVFHLLSLPNIESKKAIGILRPWLALFHFGRQKGCLDGAEASVITRPLEKKKLGGF